MMTTIMSKTRWLTGMVVMATALTFGILGISINAQETLRTVDDEESDEHEYRDYADSPKRVFVQDKVYIEECGACHFAYPPGLLPAKSWRDMMGGLEDHFGENAELDKTTTSHITRYLDQLALGKGSRSQMRKMSRNLLDKAPKRITELPYFIHEHEEIPKRMLTNNLGLGSLSQCDSCHKDAEKGVFDEDRVFIPGFGRWDE